MKSFAVLLLSVLAVSVSASAGEWSYGCVGKLDNHTFLKFNRDRLVSVSTSVPAAYESDLSDTNDLKVFNAFDINSGLEKTMSFKAEDQTTVTLTEKDSKQVSSNTKTESCSNNRVREFDDVRTLKSYEINMPGAKPSAVILQCHDIMMSACG